MLTLKVVKCYKNIQYFNKYWFQALIYRLTLNSEFDFHNDKYKFFTFSDLIPPNNLEDGKEFKIIISSPLKSFIKFLKKEFENISTFDLGPYLQLEVKNAKTFSLKELDDLKRGQVINLITGSPLYVKYSNRSWTKEDSIKYLYKTLIDLQIKRFKEYLKLLESKNIISSEKREKLLKTIENVKLPFFLNFKIKKSLPLVIEMKGKLKTLIVHRAELSLVNNNNHFTKFTIDTGIGHLNSMGLGFLNLKN